MPKKTKRGQQLERLAASKSAKKLLKFSHGIVFHHIQITSNESVDSQFLDISNIFDNFPVNSDHANDTDTNSDCVIWGPDKHESGDDEPPALSSDISGDEMLGLAWNDNALECARKPYGSESRCTQYRKKNRNEIAAQGTQVYILYSFQYCIGTKKIFEYFTNANPTPASVSSTGEIVGDEIESAISLLGDVLKAPISGKWSGGLSVYDVKRYTAVMAFFRKYLVGVGRSFLARM